MLPTTDNRFYLEEISSRSSPVPRAPFGRLRASASKGQTGSTFENPTDGPEGGVHFNENVSGGFHLRPDCAEPPSIRADVFASNTRALVRHGRLKSLGAGGPI